VDLKWHGPDTIPYQAVLYRRLLPGEWAPLATLYSNGTGDFEFKDRDLSSGSSVGYKLGILEGSIEQFYGETWVDLPRFPPIALGGLRPNPAFDQPRVSFRLADSSPARLELIDASGRRVLAREVGSYGAGEHVLELTGKRVPAGIYYVRLTQGDRSVSARAVIAGP
jgi:hypothetical protein